MARAISLEYRKLTHQLCLSKTHHKYHDAAIFLLDCSEFVSVFKVHFYNDHLPEN